MDPMRLNFVPNLEAGNHRFLGGMMPRYSAFEPVTMVRSTAAPNSFGYHWPHPSGGPGPVFGTPLQQNTEPPFRNWMVDLGGNGGRISPISPSSVAYDDDSVSSLPSPSALPFFPRKCRESRKERRARTTFTSPQTQALEVEYRQSEYISRPRRYEMATQLNLKEVQIKIWYQNRRAKDKRIEKASWDRQCRCLGLAAAAAAVNQFPSAGNYRLTTGLSGQLAHPLHMFPSSAASFPLPLLDHFQQGVNRQIRLSANNKALVTFPNLKKM